MGSLFSKKRQTRVTKQDEAILELKSQRDKLKQYQRRLEGNLERERRLAKQLIANGKKDRALLLLKKKRLQDSLIQRSFAQMDNIEKMISEIEFAQIEVSVVECLQQGNESLKRMHSLVSIEDVERIMDETRDAVEYQQEIDSIISGQLSPSELSDCEAELNELLEEQNDFDALDVREKLPDVPIGDLDVPGATKVKSRSEKRGNRVKSDQMEAEMLPS